MLEPQDLPGRYGRAVRAVDHVLHAILAEAVVGGGWAVWRHGYVGRVTQDIDIVLPATQVRPFLQAASLAGFEVLARRPGLWPRLSHKETGIEVDVLPEGGRPGTASRPAPTTIRSPAELGASGHALRYMTLEALIELKLAAGRARDESDVVELIRANPDKLDAVRRHLASVHGDYAQAFDAATRRASDQGPE